LTDLTATPRTFGSFDAAFALAFEAEISGVTFFAALAETEPEPRRSALWAKLALIEKRTAAALRPLASALGLAPSDEAAVQRSGRDDARDWQSPPFIEVMEIMVRDSPESYLQEFKAMLAVAPARAASSVQLLIDHEAAIIDMARAELSGSGDPNAPLDAYLNCLAGWTTGAPHGG
jgi:hypothetical protein